MVDMQVNTNNLDSHQVHEQDAIKDPPHAVAMAPPHHVIVVADDQTKDVMVGMVMSPHPQNQTTNPSHVIIHTPHFLRTCGLCKCHLAPGRDIYMYRGDTAFCSLECREEQMKQDQRKEKWKVASNKEDHRAPPLAATGKASTKSETAACT